jgi:hypothetical protein
MFGEPREVQLVFLEDQPASLQAPVVAGDTVLIDQRARFRRIMRRGRCSGLCCRSLGRRSGLRGRLLAGRRNGRSRLGGRRRRSSTGLARYQNDGKERHARGDEKS